MLTSQEQMYSLATSLSSLIKLSNTDPAENPVHAHSQQLRESHNSIYSLGTSSLMTLLETSRGATSIHQERSKNVEENDSQILRGQVEDGEGTSDLSGGPQLCVACTN